MADKLQPNGPWQFVEYENCISERSITVIDALGDTVCNDEPYYPQPISRENAHFIVRACNSHDAMVEALEAADQLYRSGILFMDDAFIQNVVDLRHKALRIARGE